MFDLSDTENNRPVKKRILKRVKRIVPSVGTTEGSSVWGRNEEEKKMSENHVVGMAVSPTSGVLTNVVAPPFEPLQPEEVSHFESEIEEEMSEDLDDDDEDEYDEIEEKENTPPPTSTNPFDYTAAQIRAYVYEQLDAAPHLRADQIYEHLVSQGVTVDGEPLRLLSIRSLKASWAKWLIKRSEQVRLAQNLKKTEGELAMEKKIEVRTERERLEEEMERVKENKMVVVEEEKRLKVEREKATLEAEVAEMRKMLRAERESLEAERQRLATMPAPPPPAPVPPTPVPVPMQQPQAPAHDGTVNPLVLSQLTRRKSNLEVLLERFDKAVQDNNQAMAAILLDGVYKELDKADRATDPAYGLLLELARGKVTGSDSKDPMDQMEKMIKIVQSLSPPPQQQMEGDTDDVKMAKIYTDLAKEVTGELKDTALTITGKQDTSKLFAVCPYCNETILRESVVCSFCGGRLRGQPAQGMYGQYPPQYPPQYAQSPPYPPGEGTMQSRYAQREEFEPHARGVGGVPLQKPSPEAATEPRPDVSDDEMKQLLDGAKRMSNFITSKSDPAITLSSMWKLANQEQKEFLIAAAIIGPERIQHAIRVLAPKFPEVQEYASILMSNQGQDWVRDAIQGIKDAARKEGFKVERDKIAERLAIIERRIGMPIPEKV